MAELQDEEVGDGTTSVTIVAAELLKLGNQLVKQKIHPSNFYIFFEDFTVLKNEFLIIMIDYSKCY